MFENIKLKNRNQLILFKIIYWLLYIFLICSSLWIYTYELYFIIKIANTSLWYNEIIDYFINNIEYYFWVIYYLIIPILVYWFIHLIWHFINEYEDEEYIRKVIFFSNEEFPLNSEYKEKW